ncbi:MAG TPA: NAD-dependent epimerase/dehydratase family protein [Firmicutes bacterium]|nr:NAD-dependent epimerase/dehydratase family protein [Bacillota bacterium]
MNILVTGGAGFIGSNIADAYINAGHKVVAADDLSMGDEKNVNPAARFYKIDIRDENAVNNIVESEKIEVINHHAAQISVPDSVKNPGADASVNITGTMNLLNAAAKHRIKKFIFISSGGTVYGTPDKLPVDESAPYRAETPYGISKTAGELYVKFYAAHYGIKYTILRYSNVYGPRQIPHGEAGVVAIFIKRILEGKKPVIFGGGKCVRDYVFVEDVSRANLICLDKGDNNEFNIGTGVPADVNRLYECVQKASGFKEEAESAPFREGDIMTNYLDISKAKEQLGWEPEFSLEEGVEKTYEYFKSGGK